MEGILRELRESGYDCAVAVATESEIENKAACGQMGLIEPCVNFED